MSTTTKTYKVNQIKQLIELNGSLTNFSADFIIESKDFKPFKALIISETDLNSGNPIVYQEVKDGKINGNITNDKGIYESYFILLKSDVPNECQVTINVKEVPLNSDIVQYQEELDDKKRLQFDKHKKQQEDEYFKSKKNRGKNNSKINWIFILGLVVLVCVGIWFLIKKKNKKPIIENTASLSPINVVKNIETMVELPSIPILENSLPKVELITSTPIISETNTEVPKLIETPSIGTKKNVDLVNKINNFFGK